ncbi:MAG: hypothetical protein IJK63_06415 [Oscillospiraceae bacterium]|jgi:hypothetical protein|nr:hypothetical protein [Oscillospiraceae bacterium]
MKRLTIFLCMLTNALLMGLPLLCYLDGRNPYYFGGFLRSSASKVYLCVLCVVGVVTCCLYIADLLNRDR